MLSNFLAPKSTPYPLRYPEPVYIGCEGFQVAERWEQFEVWAMTQGKWEFIASFIDFEVASAVFRNRTYRQRMLHVVYEGKTVVKQEVIAEVGATRKEA